MTIFTGLNIASAVVGIVAILGIAAILLRKRKNKGVGKRMEKTNEELVGVEKELKEIIQRKTSFISEMRLVLEKMKTASDSDRLLTSLSRKLEDVASICDSQRTFLKQVSNIERDDLRHLKHIDIDVSVKGKRMHTSQLITILEKELGDLKDYRKREEFISETNTDPDPIRRCVNFLALSLISLDMSFHTLTGILNSQKRSIAKIRKGLHKLKVGKRAMGGDEGFRSVHQRIAIELADLESETTKESAELLAILKISSRCRKYIIQLEQVEADRLLKRGPFLLVRGHQVSMVADPESRATRTFGKGEKIPLGAMADSFAIGADAHHCDIILARGASVTLLVTRKGNNCYVKAAEEMKGLSLVQGGMNFHLKPKDGKRRLKDGDGIVLPDGYVFTFMK